MTLSNDYGILNELTQIDLGGDQRSMDTDGSNDNDCDTVNICNCYLLDVSMPIPMG